MSFDVGQLANLSFIIFDLYYPNIINSQQNTAFHDGLRQSIRRGACHFSDYEASTA